MEVCEYRDSHQIAFSKVIPSTDGVRLHRQDRAKGIEFFARGRNLFNVSSVEVKQNSPVPVLW